MTNTQPSSNFQNAAAYLSSSSSLARVSNTIKLELYGLFKFVTVSRIPSTSRPSIFDMTGRAKWDAWAAVGKKYERPEEAERRYLEIARTLGWTEQEKGPDKRESETPSADEDIWDKDEVSRGSSGGSGLAVSVSSMAPPPKVIDNSIHGTALSNDITGLKEILEAHPETDLNVLDEFGYAPIHLACDRGNVEIVKLLLQQGADKTIKDPDNFSPLELSKEAGHIEIVNLLVSTP